MALANAIEALISQPARLSTMGALARNFAEKNFDINSIIQSHLDVYDHLSAF